MDSVQSEQSSYIESHQLSDSHDDTNPLGAEQEDLHDCLDPYELGHHPDEPDQVIKYNRKCIVHCSAHTTIMILMQHCLMMSEQDGFVGSFVENWFSWHLPWSSLQSLFIVEKEKRA